MKLFENKKLVCVGIALTAIVIIALYTIPSLIFGPEDQNVENYQKALSQSLSNEAIHYAKEEVLTNENGEIVGVIDYEEFYKLNSEKLNISKTEIAEHHDFEYKGYTYNYNLMADSEMVDISKREGTTPRSPYPNRVNQTYYSIDARYVTYDENDTQFIVTYENKYREKHNDYLIATSIAYFDKEWNLEKLEIVEKWYEEGNENRLLTRQITVIYHDAIEKNINTIFEEEYAFLENQLKKE